MTNKETIILLRKINTLKNVIEVYKSYTTLFGGITLKFGHLNDMIKICDQCLDILERSVK